MYPLYIHPEVFCFDVDHDSASPERDRIASADDDAATPVLAPGRAVLAAAEVTPAVQMWMNICHWATEVHRDIDITSYIHVLNNMIRYDMI